MAATTRDAVRAQRRQPRRLLPLAAALEQARAHPPRPAHAPPHLPARSCSQSQARTPRRGPMPYALWVERRQRCGAAARHQEAAKSRFGQNVAFARPVLAVRLQDIARPRRSAVPPCPAPPEPSAQATCLAVARHGWHFAAVTKLRFSRGCTWKARSVVSNFDFSVLTADWSRSALPCSHSMYGRG